MLQRHKLRLQNRFTIRGTVHTSAVCLNVWNLFYQTFHWLVIPSKVRWTFHETLDDFVPYLMVRDVFCRIFDNLVIDLKGQYVLYPFEDRFFSIELNSFNLFTSFWFKMATEKYCFNQKNNFFHLLNKMTICNQSTWCWIENLFPWYYNKYKVIFCY